MKPAIALLAIVAGLFVYVGFRSPPERDARSYLGDDSVLRIVAERVTPPINLDTLVSSCLDRDRRLLAGGSPGTPPCVMSVPCSEDQFRFLKLGVDTSSARIRFQPRHREPPATRDDKCADNGGLSAQSLDLKPSRPETTVVIPRGGGTLTILCHDQVGCSVRLL